MHKNRVKMLINIKITFHIKSKEKIRGKNWNERWIAMYTR